jgi:glutathione S-transferase
MITLHVDGFWISPYALSAFVALEEKGLPYTVREWHLEKNEHKDAAFATPSLTGRVPALQHDAFWLSESQAIGEYLAETFPFPGYPRLFPADFKERATSRQLMSWIRSDLMPIREQRATHTMFYERAKTPLDKDGQAAAARVLNVAERLVGDGRKSLFENWCLADADFGFFLMRLVLNGDPVPAGVRKYAETQWQRPSNQKFVDRPRAPYVPY